MKYITLNDSAAFTIPFCGIHPSTGRIVRSDGYVLAKSGRILWVSGSLHKAKGSKLAYRRVTCSQVAGSSVRCMLHVMVAETFLKNPNNDPTVDHIDRNTLNNDVFNLRFASYKEQALNTRRHIEAPTLEISKQLQREYKHSYYLKNATRLREKMRIRYYDKKQSSRPPVIGVPKDEPDNA